MTRLETILSDLFERHIDDTQAKEQILALFKEYLGEDKVEGNRPFGFESGWNSRGQQAVRKLSEQEGENE